MTASRLQTVLVNPVLIAVNNVTSAAPDRMLPASASSRERVRISGRAICEMLGRPESGEITKLSQQDDIRNCNEFKRKYNFDIKTECFIDNQNSLTNNNNNNNENDDDHDDDENQITTTTTTQQTSIQLNLNNNHNLVVIKGQDNESNNKFTTATATTTTTMIINNNNQQPPNAPVNYIKIDHSDSSHEPCNSDCPVIRAAKLNISNIKKSSNGNNFNINQCDDVMCNQINSTTATTATIQSTHPVDLKTATSPKDIRFVPYRKQQRQQPLISEMLKSRKASPVDVPRPQKAKLHFDETTTTQKQQQQQQLN